MDYIFDDWKKILSDFQNSVEKDLAEIHKQKNAVQQMKNEIFDRLDRGQYIYDENRIVLSAPEIIIGHVDKSGDLKGSGKVIIRGTEVDVEGVGETGAIINRAPVIQQTAVDPGIDGQEAVVYPHSAVLTQARSVVLQSNDAKDAFSQAVALPGGSGISIHADQLLDIDASVSSELRKAAIEANVSALKQQKSDLKSATDKQKSEIEQFYKDLKKLMDDAEDKNNGFMNTRVNMVDIEKGRANVESIIPALYRVTVDFIHGVSKQAELNRQITALQAEKDAIKSGDDFKNNTTSAQLSLNAETISVTTVDGDGNLRKNDGAGINVWTPQMAISMNQADNTLVEGSAFSVSTENVQISTANPKADGSEITATGQVYILTKNINIESMDYQQKDDAYTEKGLAADGKVSITAKTIEMATTNPKDLTRDDKGKVTKGEYTAEGDVIIRSKTVAVETLDYEVADGQLKPKALTKDSKIEMRSEKMGMLAADTEGKATGSISLNAKAGEDVCRSEVEGYQEQEDPGSQRGDRCLCRQDAGDPTGRRQGCGTARRWQCRCGWQQDPGLWRNHYQCQDGSQGRSQGAEDCWRQYRGQDFLQVAEHHRRHGRRCRWRRWQPECETQDRGCTEGIVKK